MVRPTLAPLDRPECGPLETATDQRQNAGRWRECDATMIPKQNRIRDEKYRRHLAEQPCRRCGQTPCQAAHLGHSGIGFKPGDDHCVSLCPECHREMDTAAEGKEKFWMTQVVIPEERVKYLEWRGQ